MSGLRELKRFGNRISKEPYEGCKDHTNNTVWQFGLPPYNLHVTVDHDCFKLHHVILAHAGSFLKHLVGDDPIHPKYSTIEVTLNNCSASAFGTICIWLYTGELTVSPENYQEVWEAAKQLKIPEVEKLCEKFQGQLSNDHITETKAFTKLQDKTAESRPTLSGHHKGTPCLDALPKPTNNLTKRSPRPLPEECHQDIVINVNLDDSVCGGIHEDFRTSPQLAHEPHGQPVKAWLHEHVKTSTPVQDADGGTDESASSDVASSGVQEAPARPMLGTSWTPTKQNQDQHLNFSIRSSELAAMVTSDFTVLLSKPLLSNRSKFFRKVLRKSSDDTIIDFRHADPITLAKAIQWMKHGECDISIWDVTSLVRLACQCRLTNLFEQCHNYMNFVVETLSDQFVKRQALLEHDLPTVKYYFRYGEHPYDVCWPLMDTISRFVSSWDTLPAAVRMNSDGIPLKDKTDRRPVNVLTPVTSQSRKMNISWQKYNAEGLKEGSENNDGLPQSANNRDKERTSHTGNSKDHLTESETGKPFYLASKSEHSSVASIAENKSTDTRGRNTTAAEIDKAAAAAVKEQTKGQEILSEKIKPSVNVPSFTYGGQMPENSEPRQLGRESSPKTTSTQKAKLKNAKTLKRSPTPSVHHATPRSRPRKFSWKK